MASVDCQYRISIYTPVDEKYFLQRIQGREGELHAPKFKWRSASVCGERLSTVRRDVISVRWQRQNVQWRTVK
jgi:hypothetical protein